MKLKPLVIVGAIALFLGKSADTSHAAIVLYDGWNTNNLPANDDGSTGSVAIGFSNPINYGGNWTNLFVNNNGNLTFAAALSTFTPSLLTLNQTIIAPFFGDVDTRGAGSDILRYGQATNLAQFGGHRAFGATWDGAGVGYFANQTNKLNKFQVILVEREDIAPGDFDICFNYDQIEWETGGASGGTNGLGGNSALVGFSNGVAGPGNITTQLAGSLVPGSFLDTNLATGLVNNSTAGLPGGMYKYEVRSGVVVLCPDGSQPPCVPEPGTAVFGLGLMGACAIGRRRSGRSVATVLG